MTLSELLPTIQSLPRADKLQLMEVLAADVVRNHDDTRDKAVEAIPIWSPYNSFEGASALLRALDENKAAN